MAYAIFSKNVASKFTIGSIWQIYLNLPHFDCEFPFFEKITLGSYVFGQKWILEINVYTLGISQIDEISVLEICRVTFMCTLCY